LDLSLLENDLKNYNYPSSFQLPFFKLTEISLHRLLCFSYLFNAVILRHTLFMGGSEKDFYFLAISPKPLQDTIIYTLPQYVSIRAGCQLKNVHNMFLSD